MNLKGILRKYRTCGYYNLQDEVDLGFQRTNISISNVIERLYEVEDTMEDVMDS